MERRTVITSRSRTYLWIALAVAWIAGNDAILRVEREMSTLLSPPDLQAVGPDTVIAAFAGLLNGIRKARAVEAIRTDAVVMLVPPIMMAVVMLAIGRPRGTDQTERADGPTIKAAIASTAGPRYTGPIGKTVNVSSTSTDWRGLALSNFGLSPFVLDETLFASVEGFIQGIKFPEGDSKRDAAFASSGWRAKSLGDTADRSGAYWGGVRLTYGSPDHHRLIERAIRARIGQSKGLQEALKSTGDAALIHDTGAAESPMTSLPAAVFCRILSEIRAELLVGTLLEHASPRGIEQPEGDSISAKSRASWKVSRLLALVHRPLA